MGFREGFMLMLEFHLAEREGILELGVGRGGGGEIGKVKEAGEFNVFSENGEKYIWTVGIC